MVRAVIRHAAAYGMFALLACSAFAQDGAAPAPAAVPVAPLPSVQTPTITNAAPPAAEGARPATAPASPTAPARAEAPAPAEALESVGNNDFQDFVAQSTGRRLPLFGHNLFRGAPSTFAPVENIPVTPEYVIGPGDELLIRAWGQIDVDYRTVVDRTGMINIPRVGSVPVAGIQFKEITPHVRSAVARNFRNFELMVTMGQLRSVQIFVVGHAQRPGAYTVSSLSTLVNAVFAAGGPSATGSMRAIQLKRGASVVTELDLYDLIAFGDKSKDRPLLPGDVIYFPPIGPMVALAGSVNQPAVYELKGDTPLGRLLDIAGGLTTTAQGRLANIERIENREHRSVVQVPLDYDGLRRGLRDGDVVSVLAIQPRFDNAVMLRGNVAEPLRHPWRRGMRVTDLLVDDNALITAAYWERQNRGTPVERPLRREVNFDFATVQRLDRNGLVTRVQAFNLGKAIAGDSFENLELQPGDAVTVYAFDEQLPRTENDVILQGSVLGVPPRRFPWREGMRLRDVIPNGEWLIDYYDYWSRVRDPGSRAELNWDYASIERLQPADLTRALLPVNLARALLDHDPSQNLPLRPGDEIRLYAKSEIASRQSRETILVRLEGEFQQAGLYQAQPGETLRQLVVRVGGLTSEAYLYGASFTRASTRRAQQERYQQTLDQLEQDVQRAAVTRAQNTMSADDAAALKQQTQAQQALVARLRTLRPEGRIVLKVPENGSIANLPDLPLEDGDRLFIPPQPKMVSVFGAVFNETAFLYAPDRTVLDYLNLAGGPRREADRRSMYLIRADGSVVSARQNGFLSSSLNGTRVHPGDTIVVPEDFERTTLTRDLKDWTQILYQFGLGAAAVHILRN